MLEIGRRDTLRILMALPLAILARPAAGASALPLDIVTTGGTVRGLGRDGVRIFTAIPYGRADRFKPARAADPWPGTLDATRPANMAPQPIGIVPLAGTPSEDCLQLNVWTPTTPGPHPVLAYIHGGGNVTGWSGDGLIAGDRFAQNDVVCVTMNYRLGVLGFAEFGDLLGPAYRSSANNGIRDILLALEWIRANIAAFGGDPNNVTIAGESAGGKNIGSLMGTPAADRLYHRAAIFSGGAQTVHTMAEAHAFARLLADKLGGPELLRTATSDELLRAQQAAEQDWQRAFPFRPVVDGAFMPSLPLARIQSAGNPAVDLLIGTNADESRLFLSSESAALPLNPKNLANETPDRMADLDRRYAKALPDLSPAERHWRLLTAEGYGIPCLRIAEAHSARGAKVHRYLLRYPAPGGPYKGLTPHAFDVALTFDHIDDPIARRFFGYSSADRQIADQMHNLVATFAAEGRPTAKGVPMWPRFEDERRLTIILDHTNRVSPDPDQAERLLWEG